MRMFRLILFFLIIDAVLLGLFLLVDFLLGHRLIVPLARLFKFKIEDLKKTEKKVDDIMGEEYSKKKAKAKGRKAKKN